MRQIFMWWKSETALLNCKLFFAGELAEWGRILSTNTQNCLNLPVNVTQKHGYQMVAEKDWFCIMRKRL